MMGFKDIFSEKSEKIESIDSSLKYDECLINKNLEINDEVTDFSKDKEIKHIDTFEEADKPLYVCDVAEEKEIKLGGSYRDVFKEGEGDKYEVHHMPPDCINGLERLDGPAIKMEKADHRLTASCGNSLEARMYRDLQADLIKQGKFKEALQMDIDDIRDKFGNKYDEGISQMKEYADKLYKEGRIQ